ncbi:MAG TPA: serine/threonine-protein kinase [Kofleriaceae bacterium]|jgi:serine/threonine-protein kinase|nr:serine/threonine-protein kinase [Kofleriaceae bacterium]
MPQRVGRYEVLTHLATGGMAQIYLARQTGLGAFERHVVLKTILRERATDQRFVTMFLDEAKLAATLNHQNIAQVYEVDQADGAYFMAMEYVHGENARAILETTLRRGWTIPLELAVMIVSGAAAGLHHAHERRGKNGQPLNIVHRDVSPANIMVGYDGSVKVLDFGIAKAEERATKTVGGTIKGKYGYMSPEQCKGKPIDRRSDIFALGICLYELTTLRRAFKGNDDFETMKRIVAGDVLLPSVAVPGYPRELEAIVLTAMANDPNARFQSGQEMIEALDAFAVRAKLTGSNTAMGRFMVQLFGSKKEPWVEGPNGGDRTQVTDASGEMSPEGDDEKTTLIESKPSTAANRAPTVPGPGSAHVGRSSGEVASLSSSAPAQQDWNHDSRAGRNDRQSSPRPGFEQPRTPPNGYQMPMTSTLAGTGPMQSIPGRIPTRAETEPGSKPLDGGFGGWQTGPNPAMQNHQLPGGGATRLPTQYQEPNYKISSNRGWIILALLMLAGLGAGVLIAMQSS